MKINERNLSIFWRFIAERHSIYKKKNLFKSPSPWTQDKILQEFKFTNVFRDLDPGTEFVIKKIIPKCNRLENLIFNIIIYRLYNKISTFEFIWIHDILSFDRNEFEWKLRQFSKNWNKVFTNAFIVSWYSFLASEWDKIARTSKIIESISNVLNNISKEIENRKTSEFTFNEIKKLPWIWDFLAYQIVVDIGYARPDIFNENIFVIAWPGCKRWLDRIFEDRWDSSYEKCIWYLEEYQLEWFENLWIKMDILFEDRNIRKLNLMALENCLCEFSKYMKALNWEWRPRNKYNSQI